MSQVRVLDGSPKKSPSPWGSAETGSFLFRFQKAIKSCEKGVKSCEKVVKEVVKEVVKKVVRIWQFNLEFFGYFSPVDRLHSHTALQFFPQFLFFGASGCGYISHA